MLGSLEQLQRPESRRNGVKEKEKEQKNHIHLKLNGVKKRKWRNKARNRGSDK